MKYLFLLHTADDGPPEDRASAEYAQMFGEFRGNGRHGGGRRADRVRAAAAGLVRDHRPGPR
jgi:hypothetical protein